MSSIMNIPRGMKYFTWPLLLQTLHVWNRLQLKGWRIFFIEDVFLMLMMEFLNAPSVYESHPQQTILKETHWSTSQNTSLKVTIKVFLFKKKNTACKIRKVPLKTMNSFWSGKSSYSRRKTIKSPDVLMCLFLITNYLKNINGRFL